MKRGPPVTRLGRPDRITEGEHRRARPGAQPTLRFGEAEVNLSGSAREPARREPGTGILLLQHRRDRRALRAPQHRSRRVAPGADDDRRLLFGEHAPHAAEDPPGEKRPAQIAPPRATVYRLERQQVVPERIVREDFLLDAAFRSDEHGLDVRPQARQRFRERQRRHEVTAGPASGENDLHCRSRPRPMLTSTPVATSATRRLDPP